MKPATEADVKACGKTLKLARDLPGERQKTQGLRILCLDGGGMRGVVALRILKALQETVDAPLADVFDLIIGTSTGGILAAALALKGLTIESCELLYNNLGEVLFGGHSTLKKLLGVLSSNTSQYKNAHKGLEELMKAVMKAYEINDTDPKLSDFKERECLFACVSAVDSGSQPYTPYVFRSYEGPKFETPPPNGADTHEVAVWQALRATSAAPFYFKAIKIDGLGTFVDGGVCNNNPVLIALAEAKALGRDIHCVVSVGTGDAQTLPPQKGLSKKLNPLAKLIAEATEANSAHSRAARTPELYGKYFRFNVPIGEADLATTDDAILTALRNSADRFLTTDLATVASLQLAAHVLHTPAYVPASVDSKLLLSQVFKTHHDADWKKMFKQAIGYVRLSFAYFGKNVRNANAEVSAFLGRGGRLECVFPDPNSVETMDRLKELMPWQFNVPSPKSKVEESLSWLSVLEKVHPGHIHVRLIPRLPHYSVYIFGANPTAQKPSEQRHAYISVFQEREYPDQESVRSPLIDVGDASAVEFAVSEFQVLWNWAGNKDYKFST